MIQKSYRAPQEWNVTGLGALSWGGIRENSGGGEPWNVSWGQVRKCLTQYMKTQRQLTSQKLGVRHNVPGNWLPSSAHLLFSNILASTGERKCRQKEEPSN